MAIRLRGTAHTFTDRVQGFWGDGGDHVFPRTWMPPARPTTRTVGTLRLPSAAAAKLHTGAMNPVNVALYASLAARPPGAPAGLHRNREGEGTGQAARLAAWEDEGGATACVK